jgi:hypothetical protein
MNGHDGIADMVGDFVTSGRGLDQLKLVRTELALPQ